MKRRGFLSLLGITGGIAATGAAFALPAQADDNGIYVSLNCGNDRCAVKFIVPIDLTKPIMMGPPQCPFCLWVMALPNDTAKRIKEWHVSRDRKTDIYTPLHG